MVLDSIHFKILEEKQNDEEYKSKKGKLNYEFIKKIYYMESQCNMSLVVVFNLLLGLFYMRILVGKVNHLRTIGTEFESSIVEYENMNNFLGWEGGKKILR